MTEELQPGEQPDSEEELFRQILNDERNDTLHFQTYPPMVANETL